MNKITELWNIFWRGMCMGLADLVPGVSGGTMALLLGIYKRFLASLSGFTRFEYRLFFQFTQFKANIKLFWQSVDGWFLLSLLAGIITSVIVFASSIKYLLENQEVLLIAFFLGLMLATLFVLIRQLEFNSLKTWLLFFAGILFATSLNYMPFKLSGVSLWHFYIAGLVASCFMLLPGVSGSFMLLLLGIYPGVINAIHSLDLEILVLFALGVATGFLFFSRFLNNLLSNKYNSTMLVLTGFVAGSLPNLWPWQIIKSYEIINDKIKIIDKELISPASFEYILGNSHLIYAIACIILAFILTIYLTKLGDRHAV